MRAIEQIEEDQMRNIFQVKTGIQVPIQLIYLELGQVPERFQIQRFKLNFLQYINFEEIRNMTRKCFRKLS